MLANVICCMLLLLAVRIGNSDESSDNLAELSWTSHIATPVPHPFSLQKRIPTFAHDKKKHVHTK
jgi:hypothetical protein